MSFHPRLSALAFSAMICLPLGTLGISEIQAQSDSSRQSAKDPTTLMEDFLHYVRIAKPDLAEAAGNALMDSGVSDTDLAMIVYDNNLEDKLVSVLQRGRRMEGVSDLVAAIETRVEKGRIELARNPERVREAVKMLTGTLRQKMLAKDRLLAAGEYAVPALLEPVINGKDPQLEVACTAVIEEIKRQAVFPLCAALGAVDVNGQRKICNMLGAIGYPAAEPFLLQLAQADSTPDTVKASAMAAFKRLGGTSTSVSSQFTALGRRFFDGQMSLVAWPGEALNNIWHYDTYAGLTPTSVPTPIYGDVMAMTMARTALGYDKGSRQALALFVAGDLRRQNDLPDGASDPIFGGKRYSPEFFATAAGTSVAQDVLSMSIDRYDTALIRDSIAALSKTTGASNIFASARQPLLECLRYPDRRVQYDTALVIARALPKKNFPGDDIVVPLLGSAVRDSDAMYGIIVATNDEDRRTYAGDLQKLGFTTLNGGQNYADVRNELARSVGLDLVVIRGEIDMIRETIQALRNDNLTAAVPVIASANNADQSQLSTEFSDDRATIIWTAGRGADAFANAVDQLLERTGGARFSEDDARAYMLGALDALRQVAVDGNSVLAVSEAETPLLESLSSRDGHVRLLVAEVVSLISGSRSQQALLDVALDATGSDQIDLLDLVAASARRFGNNAATRQIDGLRTLISKSTGDTADAAGRAYGALNVGPEETVKLILD
jgi:hypothetical protein